MLSSGQLREKLVKLLTPLQEVGVRHEDLEQHPVPAGEFDALPLTVTLVWFIPQRSKPNNVAVENQLEGPL